MTSALLRRSALVSLAVAAATVASPLVGTASAATLAAPTFTPAAGATVKAARPAISAAYAAPLSTSASTLTLTDTSASNATVPCPVTFANSNQTIGCTPTQNLLDNHVYKVAVHAVSAASATDTRDDSVTWTVDVPSPTSITPHDGDVVGPTPTVKAVYDEALDPSSSVTITNDATSNSVSGGTLSASSPVPNSPKDTITFTPANPLPSGTYTVAIHAVASGNNASYSDTTEHITVTTAVPSAPPTVTTVGYTAGDGTHWINSGNQHAVPFGGKVEPNMRVLVAIYDPTDPQSGVTCDPGTCSNDSENSVFVPSCGASVTSCDWSLTVDTGSSPDKAYKWFARAYTAAGHQDTAPGDITKDTAAPAQPSSAGASMSGSNVTVTAADYDISTDHYQVVVTDPAGGTLTNGAAAGTGASHPLTTTFDIGSLEDGESGSGPLLCPGSSVAPALNVAVQAVDKAGNFSSAKTTTVDKETRTLEPGATGSNGSGPDWSQSFLTINGQHIPLDQLAGRSINTPTSVTIHFNELIRPSASASTTCGLTGSTYATSGMQVVDSHGFALQPASLTASGHDLVWTFGAASDSGSPYSIQNVTAVAGSCPNDGATGSNCEVYRSQSNTPIATFTIDNTPPQTHITSLPAVIDANTVRSVLISGTADPDTTAVTLRISTAVPGYSPLLVNNVTLTPPAPPTQPMATWSAVVDLTSRPDSVLTVVAKATDAAGNSTDVATDPDATKTSILAARPSAPRSLGIANDGPKAIVSWLPPGYAGGSGQTIASYSLSYTDAAAPNSPVTVTNATSPYTINGLLLGHAYTVKVWALNSGAVPCPCNPAVGTFTARLGTRLTELASPSVITYGGGLTLSGRLTIASTGTGNNVQEPISIRPKFDNGTWGGTTTVRTDNFGNWHLPLRLSKNATFYATFPGDSSYNASTAVTRVLVRALVKITGVSSTSSSHLRAVTLSGTVSPNQAGRRVYFYRVVNGRSYNIGYTTLNSSSRFSWSYKFPRGTNVVFARFNAQNGNTTGNSNTVKFTRS